MNIQERNRILREAEHLEADLIEAERKILENLGSFIDHALTKEYFQ